jgi:hypothetical protein
LPQFEKNTRFYPFLKAVVGCRMGAQLGLVQGLPRASGSQDKENRIRTVSIRHPWSSPSKAVRIDMHGQEGLQNGPQLITDPEARCRWIIRRSLPFSFLGWLVAHTPILSLFEVIRIGFKQRY